MWGVVDQSRVLELEARSESALLRWPECVVHVFISDLFHLCYFCCVILNILSVGFLGLHSSLSYLPFLVFSPEKLPQLLDPTPSAKVVWGFATGRKSSSESCSKMRTTERSAEQWVGQVTGAGRSLPLPLCRDPGKRGDVTDTIRTLPQFISVTTREER